MLEILLLSRGHENVSTTAQQLLHLWKKLEKEFGHKSHSFFTIRNLFGHLQLISVGDDVLETFKSTISIELSQRLDYQKDLEDLAIILVAEKTPLEKDDNFEEAIESAAKQLKLILTPHLLKNVIGLENLVRLNKSVIISGDIASGKTTTWKVSTCKS